MHPFATWRNRFAFTLLELAVALVIVGILAALATTSYRVYLDRTELSEAISDIQRIDSGIERWITEFGSPPMSLSDVGLDGLLDPWGNPYQYLNINDPSPGTAGRRRKDHNLVPINSDYDLYSMGEDGRSVPPLTGGPSRDDVVRGRDGAFIGLATDY